LQPYVFSTALKEQNNKICPTFLLRRHQDFDKQYFNQGLLTVKHKNTLKIGHRFDSSMLIQLQLSKRWPVFNLVLCFTAVRA